MERARSVKDGGTLKKIGRSPTKRSLDFPFQARSSIELAKRFKQVKQEKIDKLHERLQGNNREKVQEVVEVAEETLGKRTHGKTTMDRLHERLQGNSRENVQKVDGNLDKSIATNKIGRAKVNQNHSVSQRNREENLGQLEAMESFAQGDKYINQEQQVANTNNDVVEGTLKKRARGKTTIDRLGERLQGNNRDKVQKVDNNLDKNMAANRILTASIKSKKQEQLKLSLDTMMSNTQCSKKEKKVPTCPSMLIDDFIELQRSKDMAATKSFNGEKTPSNCHLSSNQPLKVNQDRPTSTRNREEHLRQPEVMEEFAQVEGDINQEVEEATNTNREEKEGEGTSKRRTRGKTLCKNIHARTMDEREEMTLNEDGQPNGPSNKVVSDLSLFLGTLARNSAFCPLIYTSWTDMLDDNIKRIWKYTNKKFILPDEARDWVETAVRDAWR